MKLLNLEEELLMEGFRQTDARPSSIFIIFRTSLHNPDHLMTLFSASELLCVVQFDLN